jgi:hypothetical protein
MKITDFLFFVLSVALFTVNCKKKDECNDCPRGRTCVESSCECDGDNIPIGDNLCAYPNSFIAYNVEAWNCAPDTFMIHSSYISFDSLGNAPLGPLESIDGLLVHSPNGSNNSSGSFNYINNGPGLVGDQFYIYAPFGGLCYPSAIFDGSCYSRLTGTFIHPDTIRALFTMENCNPEDLPEAQNQLRIMLYRVKK